MYVTSTCKIVAIYNHQFLIFLLPFFVAFGPNKTTFRATKTTRLFEPKLKEICLDDLIIEQLCFCVLVLCIFFREMRHLKVIENYLKIHITCNPLAEKKITS